MPMDLLSAHTKKKEVCGSECGQGESASEEDVGVSYGNYAKLTTFPMFSREDRDDVDSRRRWLAKLEHAKLQYWTKRENSKCTQLAGRSIFT